MAVRPACAQALDAQGNLHAADDNNNRVMEYAWALVKINLPLVWR